MIKGLISFIRGCPVFPIPFSGDYPSAFCVLDTFAED
jgi:hypothetical protein